MTTKSEIQSWFERGVSQGATHMIVACDTFDWEDYPVFVQADEDVNVRVEEFRNKAMQKVMEVYKLSDDMGAQLDEHRAFHL